MQLEKIEMSGFKSFADKTVIEFDKGVTAVVGPNGSGKSNLSEAIKWVLGEQSAKSLRGKKMDDVIFAGSESRKAVNIAEVTLTINNEDHTLPLEQTEVVLTRRLNRDGVSDFFINKKPCRLKDITNLMMDSGLGKDSFALISQGKVEKIFNDRPEERRMIIEEAAGVLKYKDRKYQATKKLEQTQDHLNRVEDIIGEIETQLFPLEQQRTQAIAYLDHKQQLANVETALLVVEIETLNTQWKLAQKETGQLQQEIQRIELEQENQTIEMEHKQDSLLEVSTTLDTIQEQYVKSIQSLEQLEGERKVLLQKQEYLKQSEKEHEEAHSRAVHEEEELEQQLSSIKSNLQIKKMDVEQNGIIYERVLQELNQLTEMDEDSLKEKQAEYIQLLQEETKAKNQERHFEKTLESIDGDKEKYELTIEKQQMIQQQLEEQLNQCVVESETLEKIIFNEEKNLNDFLLNLTLHKETYQEESQSMQKMNYSLQHKEAQLHSLQQVSNDYAGYFQGVREVLKRKPQLPGVISSVAECIQVDDKYTLAIDIALGAASQYILTEDERSASLAIQLLKQERLGRATFLPLSIIRGKEISSTVYQMAKKYSSFIGVASDLVQVDETFTSVISQLLGNTLVATTLKEAQKIAKDLDYRYRMVTLEGDVINPGGSMTGGATKSANSQSLLQRNTQLHRLQEELEKLRAQWKQQKHIFDELTVKGQKLEEQCTIYQKKVDELHKRKQELNFQKQLHEQEIAQSQKQLNLSQFELEQAIEEYEIIENQYIQNHEFMVQTSLRVSQLRKEIEMIQLSQEDRTLKVHEKQQQLQTISIEKATLEEQKNQLERDIRTIQANVKRVRELLKMYSSKHSQHVTHRNEDSQRLLQLEEHLEKENQVVKEMAINLQQCKEEKNQLELNVKQLEIQRNFSVQQLQSLYKNLTKSQTKESRLEWSIDQKLLYLNEEYELTYEAASQKNELDMSIEEAGSLVRTLKQTIDQMGAVNLMAIEEYEKVSERFDFLSAQRSDLLEAKEILESTIKEMDEEVKTRFKETFDAICLQFEKTFPRLFGGGKASLELTDPSNLLETGIDIIAQPPGKKLQSLSLLSGGERAFTAIALLFAILEVKPVPFCLLDEVEAALDESNVVRYGRYLKEFTQSTQFIVITHRRGTMEEADVLYGVTMQESGVSKLASVKFEDFEE